MWFSGRVAVVTGGGSGIGEATAKRFADEGAAVAVLDVDGQAADRVASEIVAGGGRSRAYPVDVADPGRVATVMAAVVEDLGGLDLACNNAGIFGDYASTADCQDEVWARTLAVNLTGVFNCMRHELRHMLGAGSGSIVNVSSGAGLVGAPMLPAYSASKHGVVGLTRTAALEYGRQGIRVNAVCPGTVRTPMLESLFAADSNAEALVASAQPNGRIGDPAEIAAAVVWLCSDEGSFVNGHAFAVDGGMVAQ